MDPRLILFVSELDEHVAGAMGEELTGLTGKMVSPVSDDALADEAGSIFLPRRSTGLPLHGILLHRGNDSTWVRLIAR